LNLKKAVTDMYMVATIASLFAVSYHGTLKSFGSTLEIPDYSYLIVLVPISLFVVDRLLSMYSSINSVDAFAFTASIGGVILAESVLALSRVLTEYSLQLEVLSAIILVGSVLLFVYGEFKNALAPLTIWILLLSLVPLPRSIIDYLAAILTKPLAHLATILAGGRLTESSGYLYVSVIDKLGVERKFFISPECSGVISLLSVLALTPIILYIILMSRAPVRKKIASFVYSILSAVLIALTGNILRIAIMIYITRAVSYSTAITFFHQTPSIIYSALATIVAIYIAIKLTPPKRVLSNTANRATTVFPWLTGSDIVKGFGVIFLVLLFASMTHIVLAQNTTSNGLKVDPNELISSPEKIIFNSTSLHITYNTQTRPLVGEALGALTVHSLTLQWKNLTSTGWVEVAETPSRFHGWQVCLTNQGYRIEKWWSETGNLTINYALISKAGQKLLLVYTIVRYPTNIGNLYVKISIFTPVSEKDYQYKAQQITSMLEELNLPTQPSGTTQESITLLYIGLTLILVSSILGFAYKLKRKL